MRGDGRLKAWHAVCFIDGWLNMKLRSNAIKRIHDSLSPSFPLRTGTGGLSRLPVR